MNDLELEIQKRHTVNWLIQGAAQHAGMTFHHLVRDELNALNPGLVECYDQYALINLLQYWQLSGTIAFGSPARFWNQAASKSSHPFFGHPLLAKYGGMLAEAGRQRALTRCQEKGFNRLALEFMAQTRTVVPRLRVLEAPHGPKLVHLAKATAALVWGIPVARLDAELCPEITLQPDMIPARNMRGEMFRASIVGYGGVERRGDALMVIGKGTNWQLLAKELVKGTAELICLHGLNRLSDDTYERVLEVTDQIDLEPAMLQSGGELWRRLLATFPDGVPLAQVLMRLARLPVQTLHSVVAAAIERAGGIAENLAGDEKRSSLS